MIPSIKYWQPIDLFIQQPFVSSRADNTSCYSVNSERLFEHRSICFASLDDRLLDPKIRIILPAKSPIIPQWPPPNLNSVRNVSLVMPPCKATSISNIWFLPFQRNAIIIWTPRPSPGTGETRQKMWFPSAASKPRKKNKNNLTANASINMTRVVATCLNVLASNSPTDSLLSK